MQGWWVKCACVIRQARGQLEGEEGNCRDEKTRMVETKLLVGDVMRGTVSLSVSRSWDGDGDVMEAAVSARGVGGRGSTKRACGTIAAKS